MEKIDLAYARFLDLLNEVNGYQDTIFTEQDARVKIVDRILIEILEWEYEDILRLSPNVGHFSG